MTQDNLDMGTDNHEDVQGQDEGKRFSQTEIDKIVADRVARERSKYEKKYAGVDLDRYNQLTEAEESRKLEEQKARGEFESILKSTVDKKDAVISKLQSELKSVKIDEQLKAVAYEYKAVNAPQVVKLLRDQVRLGEEGQVEVIDDNGQLMYNDKGEAYGIKDLAKDFFKSNPHFISATPPGSGSKSSATPTTRQEKASGEFNMKDPEARKEAAKKYNLA